MIAALSGPVARGLQFSNSVLLQMIGQIGDAILVGVLGSFEFGVCLGRLLAQFGNVRLSTLGTVLATIEHVRQKSLKSFGL